MMLNSLRCLAVLTLALGFAADVHAAPPDGKGSAKTPSSKLSSGAGKALGAKKATSPQAGGGRIGQNPQSNAGKGGRDFVKTPQGWFRRDQRHAAHADRVAERAYKVKAVKDKLSDGDTEQGASDNDKQSVGPHRRMGTPSNREQAHAHVLQKRLAVIDKMRDKAIETGDEALLEKADKLEQQARDWHARQSGQPTPAVEPGEPTTPPTDSAGPILPGALPTAAPTTEGPSLTPLP